MRVHGAGLALHPAQGSTTNWPRNWESDPRLTEYPACHCTGSLSSNLGEKQQAE